MTYKLFIDDERFPVAPDCMIARSSREAILMVEYYGMPNEIIFDHDLGFRDGGEDTSIIFINWLTNKIIDGYIEIPKDFVYTVISQNPIGRENIIAKMENLLKHFA